VVSLKGFERQAFELRDSGDGAPFAPAEPRIGLAKSPTVPRLSGSPTESGQPYPVFCTPTVHLTSHPSPPAIHSLWPTLTAELRLVFAPALHDDTKPFCMLGPVGFAAGWDALQVCPPPHSPTAHPPTRKYYTTPRHRHRKHRQTHPLCSLEAEDLCPAHVR
jgi:hypothetical protein